MIVIAAVGIAATAVPRLIDPQPIEQAGIGLAVAAAASLINLGVGLLLLREGQKQRSPTLEANGRHLLTDVWTSVGVIVGVAAVAATGWNRLDAIIAIAVAANIVITGMRLVGRSLGGLMDRSLSQAELERIHAALAPFEAAGVRFHALRTRQAGQRAFVSVHVLVPSTWTVQRGHDLVERVEASLRQQLPYATVFTHLEPADDPRSFEDADLDRTPPEAELG